MSKIISLEDQLKDIAKEDYKTFIKEKFKHYKSSPQGCIDYIQECLYVPVPGIGYIPFILFDTQKTMIYDLVDCMFNKKKDTYVILGSRQCGKTTCLTAVAD